MKPYPRNGLSGAEVVLGLYYLLSIALLLLVIDVGNQERMEKIV